MTQNNKLAMRAFAPALIMVAAVLALSGCSGKKDAAASQVAVRVNDADITVHQINFRLQQDRNVRPDNQDAASARVLEQLIDQELAVQKATSLKLDKDPRVLQALEAARREVLARAYVEQIVQSVAKPADDKVRQYFDEHPELFAQRRVYSLQELAIETPAAKLPALREHVASAKSLNDLGNWLKAENLRVGANSAVRAAEQLPMNLLGKLNALSDGSGMIVSEGPVVRVVFRSASRSEPVPFDRAKPAIEQFLSNLARREAVDNSIKGLRTASKLEYQGKYVALAASQPALSTTRDASLQVNLPASGSEVSLPNAGQASASTISLPNAGQASAAEVTLKPTASGVEVSLQKGNAGAADARSAGKALGVK